MAWKCPDCGYLMKIPEKDSIEAYDCWGCGHSFTPACDHCGETLADGRCPECDGAEAVPVTAGTTHPELLLFDHLFPGRAEPLNGGRVR